MNTSFNIPGTYSAYWADGNFNQWNEELAIYKDKKCDFLEVGSYEGRLSVFLIKYILTHKNASLTVVDTFEGGSDQDEFQENIKEGRLYTTFEANTKSYSSKIKIIVGKTKDELPKLKKKYDVIYHDASHLAQDVYDDLVLLWPLLKEDGLLLIDDYSWTWDYIPNHNKNPLVDDPKVGIDKFLDSIKGEYEEVYRLHQLHIRKVVKDGKSKR